MTARRLLLIVLAVAFCGLLPLLAASDAAAAAVAVAIAGLGIGACFPLTSSLHVGTSHATSTVAVGQVMAATDPAAGADTASGCGLAVTFTPTGSAEGVDGS